ncbi:unnamed protein product, partial [Brassica oleracea]
YELPYTLHDISATLKYLSGSSVTLVTSHQLSFHTLIWK